MEPEPEIPAAPAEPVRRRPERQSKPAIDIPLDGGEPTPAPEPETDRFTGFFRHKSDKLKTPDQLLSDREPAPVPVSPAEPARAAAPAPQPVVTETPAASTEDNTPAVDTRTEQQKEIDEAIANGTWGIEYTTCQKCGYHNWTRQGNVYVCDTCGNTTTTVVGPKGVKGYVGSGAIAAVAPKASAPETRYATAAEAQAAADKREAAYAAAVAAFQKQIDAQNAAYLAALGK